MFLLTLTLLTLASDPLPPAAQACATDRDCVVCHDGSACGIVVSRDYAKTQGDACRLPDTAECEFAVPRCDEQRCVLAPK